MFTSPIRYALLIAVALWSTQTDAQEDLILRTGTTSHVWTFSREMAGIALTELWTNGTEREQCLGIFPGRPGQLGRTETGTIIYQSIPLVLPAPGDILHRGHTISLAPSRYWELTSPGRDVLIIDDPDLESIIWTTEKAIKGLKPVAPAIDEKALPNLASGFNAVRLAQLSLSRWEFKQAAAYYKQAARHFETLARQSAKNGLSESPMQDYVQAFQTAAREIQKNGSRWVCRDHLTAIARLLTAYRRDHRGEMPDQIAALQTWAVNQSRADPEAIARLFRAPVDRDKTRPISYFYRPNAAIGEAIVISYFYPGRLVELIRHTENYRVQDRSIGQTQIDSLLIIGKTLLSQNDTLAVPVLTVLTRVAPEMELGHCLLGYAYLEVEDYDRARNAFERAIDLNHRLSEAYNGLGLVFQNRPKGMYNAIRYFRRALQWPPNEQLSQLYNIHRDARFNMAQARYKLKEYDTKRDLNHVIALDPTYAPTYKLLGKWWEEQEEDYEQAAMAYARYITLAPEDPEGRELLSRAYLRSKNFNRIVQLLEDHIREHPEEITSLPILAQACLELKRPNWAQTYFSRYVAHLDPQHRALYEDIQFLASVEELEEYNSLDTDAARSSFLRQFWALKDPNLITAINERKLEHYRRVWYALTNFSEGKKPFDRRGEVYIRFGEPDYRSRSNMLNLQQSLSVQRVKERVAQTLFGGEAAQQTYFGPVYPVRGLQARLSGATPCQGATRGRISCSRLLNSHRNESDRDSSREMKNSAPCVRHRQQPMTRPEKTSALLNGGRIQSSTPGIWAVNFLISSRISTRSLYRKTPLWFGGRPGSIQM